MDVAQHGHGDPGGRPGKDVLQGIFWGEHVPQCLYRSGRWDDRLWLQLPGQDPGRGGRIRPGADPAKERLSGVPAHSGAVHRL